MHEIYVYMMAHHQETSIECKWKYPRGTAQQVHQLLDWKSSVYYLHGVKIVTTGV